MGLFGSSLEKEAKEAAEKVSAQFPGSSITAEVHDKVVTLGGTAPDVVTKREIMEKISALLPDAGNVVNSIRSEHAGSAAAGTGSSFGTATASAGQAVPSSATPTMQHVGGTVHVVESGDTLSGIAKRYLGNAGAYMKIFEANRDVLKDPDKIFPGQKLKIPG